jgi:hypothetical protein
VCGKQRRAGVQQTAAALVDREPGVSRMLWLELIVWLPALFVLAALLDNVYHDCS